MLTKEVNQRISWKDIFNHPKIIKAVRNERKR
jgi:hypothetical protein